MKKYCGVLSWVSARLNTAVKINSTFGRPSSYPVEVNSLRIRDAEAGESCLTDELKISTEPLTKALTMF